MDVQWDPKNSKPRGRVAMSELILVQFWQGCGGLPGSFLPASLFQRKHACKDDTCQHAANNGKTRLHPKPKRHSSDRRRTSQLQFRSVAEISSSKAQARTAGAKVAKGSFCFQWEVVFREPGKRRFIPQAGSIRSLTFGKAAKQTQRPSVGLTGGTFKNTSRAVRVHFLRTPFSGRVPRPCEIFRS